MQLASAKLLGCILALLLLTVVAQPAKAGYSVTFARQTSNGTQDVAGQLRLTIEDQGGSNVRFVFRNVGPVASRISEIYFDDGSLIGSAFTLNNGIGVDFQMGGNPATPPGISGFDATVNLVLRSQAAKNAATGIDQLTAASNTDEFLNYNFALINNQKFADVITSLQIAQTGGWNVDTTGGLRIALHVKSIGKLSNSDSFLSDGFRFDGNSATGEGPEVTSTPAPASLVLAALGIPIFLLPRLRRRAPLTA